MRYKIILFFGLLSACTFIVRDRVTEEFCGDGVRHNNLGEQCDENDVGGASCEGLGLGSGFVACSDQCTLDTTGCSGSFCGDGNINPGEECDNGPQNSDTAPNACRSDCQNASCGDGVIDTGEDCDDQNANENDGCNSQCRRVFEVCNDGIDNDGDNSVDCTDNDCFGAGNCQPEICDDGFDNNLNNLTDCDDPQCAGAINCLCGNGAIDGSFGEECDGQNLDGESCTSIGFDGGTLSCRINCRFDVSQCFLCGNGIEEAGEDCDDGNTANGDSCNNDCTFPVCGDGIVNGGAGFTALNGLFPQAGNFNPELIAVADLNGDGLKDVVTGSFTNGLSENVVVFKQVSGNSFIVMSPFVGGLNLSSLDLIDFDGDGRLDIVTVAKQINNGLVSFFRNTTASVGADPAFTAAGSISNVGNGPSDVAVLNFDNDSDPDLVLSNDNAGFITPLRNDTAGGNATFAILGNIGLGFDAKQIIAADFNADTFTDVFVLSRANFGVGSLQGLIVLDNSATILGGGQIGLSPDGPVAPIAAAVGDLDNNNRPDIVFTFAGANPEVRVLLEQAGDYNLSSVFPSGSIISFPEIGRFNGDNKADLVLGRDQLGDVAFFFGNGTGSFGFAAPAGAVGLTPKRIIATNINNDPHTDVIFASPGNNSVQPLLLSPQEDCDDGNANNNDACPNSCNLP